MMWLIAVAASLVAVVSCVLLLAWSHWGKL